MSLSRYSEVLPHEPSGFALRRVAKELHKQRVQLRVRVALSEREERSAHAERRYPLLPSSRILRGQVREIGAVVAWLDFRADMQGL